MSFSESSRRIQGKDAQKGLPYQATSDDPYRRVFGSPYVTVLEQILSKELDGASVLEINNGTGAISIALKIFGIGRGDEVIIPAFCSSLIILPVSRSGATPVFSDICLNDYALDPAGIEEKITEHTKAIIVAHLFGQPALGIKKILEIAKEKSLPVIECASQSLGATIKIDGKQKLVGTLGDIGYLRFPFLKQPTNPGNASALVFKQKNVLYETARNTRASITNSMPEENQTIRLLERFKFLNDRREQRKKLAEYYTKNLSDISDIILPGNYTEAENVWARYFIRTERRDALFKYFSDCGIKSVRLPVRHFSHFQKKYKQGTFPISEKVASSGIFLPGFGPRAPKDEDIARIVELIKIFFQK